MRTSAKTALRIVAGLAGAVGVAAAYGFFDARFILESKDGRRASRRLDTDMYRRGDFRVRLVRRLSDAPCRRDLTWGVNGDHIWVDRGCRAEFLVEYVRDWDKRRWDDDDYWYRGGRWNNNATWNNGVRPNHDWNGIGRREFQLESNGNRRAEVLVDTRGGVRLVRQLSDAPCIEGRSWGYGRDRIWVSRGCRAVFEVRGR